ncbi:hypothetical protein JTB14_029512 [Gonioctena quinquepunctata]|nr:hypothetical protein JTB14_029512 [Gonioctena quinquepunctata]
MLYEKKWYSGVVIDIEENVAAEWSSEDDVPLTNFSNVLKNSKTLQHNDIGFQKEISFDDLKNNKNTTNQISISSAGAETMMEREPIPEIEITDDFVGEVIDAEHNETVSPSHSIDMSLSDPFSGYDSDADPPYRATCEVYKCKREVFSSCHRYLILLCFDHFENYYDSCNDHSSKKARHNKIFLNESTNDTNKKRENNVSKRETDDAIKWNDIMEVKVSKLHPDTLFFKSSHNQQEYSKITLERQKKINLKTVILRPLNEEPNKIGKAKYKDLMSLCQGVTPVVKIAEYRDFHASLPHTDN